MEFSKLTQTSLYRLCAEIVAMLNAELDHGTFKVDPAPAPVGGRPDYIERRNAKNLAKYHAEKELKKGSLIGKNDRSVKGITNEHTEFARRIEDHGIHI